MNALPPRHLCIAASLLIGFIGVGALVEIIFSLFYGPISLNLSILAIPIGYALLRQDKATSWVTLSLSVVYLLIFVGFFIFLAVAQPVEIFSADGGVLLIEALATIATAIYLIWVLTRPDVREWFEQEDGNRAFAKSLLYSVLVVSGLLFLSVQVSQWWMRDTLDSVYSFQVMVEPYDAVTGERVRSYKSDGEWIGSSKPLMEQLPKYESSASSTPDGGLSITYEGIAKEPVHLTYLAEGYEPKPFVIDRKVKGKLRLELQPKVNDSASTEE